MGGLAVCPGGSAALRQCCGLEARRTESVMPARRGTLGDKGRSACVARAPERALWAVGRESGQSPGG